MESIKWDIESRCNLNCKHCIVGHTKYCSDLSLVDKIKVLENLKKSGINNIVLSTKEPLLMDDLIDFLRQCRINNISITIATNGTLLSSSVLEELNKGFVNQIAISLEGLSETTNDYVRGKGSFNKTIHSLKLIRESNLSGVNFIPVVLQINITPSNFNEIMENLEKFVEEYLIQEIIIGGIVPYGNAIDFPDLMYTYSEYKFNIDLLIKHYSSSHIKAKIKFKDLMPFETAIINFNYGYNLINKIPNCKVCSGKNITLMPDGSICRCSLLIGTGIIDDSDLCMTQNLINSTIPEIDIPNISSKYPRIKRGFCKECILSDHCNICYLYTNEGHVREEISDACKEAYIKLESIVKDACNLNIRCKWNENCIIECNSIVSIRNVNGTVKMDYSLFEKIGISKIDLNPESKDKITKLLIFGMIVPVRNEENPT